jgi:hypothetical protein
MANSYLNGTLHRPVVLVKPEFKALPDNCQIEYFQISEDGKWINFHSADTVLVFSIQIGIFNAMRKTWEGVAG